MKILLNQSPKLKAFMNLDIDSLINKALIEATLLVQNKAKQIAPYDTGTLRRSITSDFSMLKQGITVVGSPVPYARRRHYENYKNPQTLFYLHRAYDENKKEIKRIFKKSFKKVTT